MNGFTSKLLHTDDKKDDPHGALRFPIYECAAFEFESAEALAASFDGSKPAHAYGRVSNPTVEAFEQRICAMSGGTHAIAFASGMAAITNVVLTLCECGSNIVASKYLFGNTVSLFEKTLGPWGLTIKWVDPNNLDEVAKSIDSQTRMVFVETISNPQIVVADVKKLAELCTRMNVLFVLDNSLATSYLLRSIDFNIPLEIVSTAKYISGGGTAVGGVVIDNGLFDWRLSPKMKNDYDKWGKATFVRTLRSYVARNTGACLSPHAAYLHMLGLETLALRIEKSSRNALDVAMFLESNTKVASVNYPSLTSSPFYKTAQSQFTSGNCGGLLSFTLKESISAHEFLNRLAMIKRSSNFNDNKSLVIHPASTLFCEYTDEKLSGMNISRQLIRLSVGIEDVEDIISDIEQALQ